MSKNNQITKKKKVLLIGWDAADWKVINPLIDEGKMPNLEKLVNGGVIGNLATLDPPLSPTLWTSIATGKRPYKHGIHGFTEVDHNAPSGVRPVYITSRKVRAIWNMLSNRGYKTNVVGWWPSHPAEPINGTMVSNFYQKAHKNVRKEWPLTPGAVFPEEKAQFFANMRVHPQELTKAHLMPFVPTLTKEKYQDKTYRKRIDAIGKITADCSTVHAAATYIMEYEEWDFMAVYLDAIDHYCHGFMKYHPPRRPHIKEADFELFKDVVVAGYRYHDMMLGRLMALAGEDTTIILVSDHGFHPDHLRPTRLPLKEEPAAPALEHSPYGVIIMKGPGIKKDERINGASLLDITPTLLYLCDLPLARDMDGKVLTNAFETLKKDVQIIDSWENEEGDFFEHPEDMQTDPEAAKALLEQLADLGYIEKPTGDKEKNIARTEEFNKYFLARAYIDGRQPQEALPLFKDLFEKNPTKVSYGIRLANCLMALQQLKEAREVVDAITELHIDDTPTIHLLNGGLLLSENKLRSAMKEFQKAEALASPTAKGVNQQVGNGYLALKRLKKAEESFKKELQIDYENPGAHVGLGVAIMQQGRFEEASESLLTALGFAYHNPIAHFHLGECLFHLKKYQESANAFEVALRIIPHFQMARQWMVRIYRDFVKNPEKVKQLTGQTDEMREKRGRNITLVSGLPRSGTSMMMQMLEKGGMDVLTDKQRKADESNPKGYYEHEAIKSLGRDKRIIRQIEENMTAKIIANLLVNLPKIHQYKIVFMERDLQEILTSQHKMLVRNKKVKEDTMPLQLLATFKQTLKQIKNWLKQQENIKVLFVSHRETMSNPLAQAQKVKRFLGTDLDENKMAAVVDTSLYRQRITTPTEEIVSK